MNILSGPDNGGSDSDTADLNTITIDENYAKRYNHNKKREDLQRYEELKLRKLIQDEDNQEYDDSSGDDDEDDDVIKFDPKQEVQFVDALLRIRNKDPVLKNKEVKLFDDVADDDYDVAGDDVEKKKKKKKEKKVYLKDVNASMLLENGADFADDVSDDDVAMEKKSKEKSFVEQQAASQKEFLDALEAEGGDEDDGDIFKVKESGKEEEEEDEDEVEYEKKLDEYFANDDKLNEDDKGFLRDYFGKKMWLGKDDGDNGFDEFDIDVSDDDEIMARQEDYEREINFRHQEGGEDHVMVHPRKILDSVRKVESKRKRQRESKKEREEVRKNELIEEIKHLKNVKKEDMNEKLKKFREIAGIGDGEDCVLDEGDLEGDFDPDEYDRKMKKAFDDKFYNAKDVDPNFASDEDDNDDEDGEMEKPNFDEEDELLGLPKGWDDKFGLGDGFAATREKVLKKKGKNYVHEEEVEEVEEEETEMKEGKKKRKRKTSKLEEEFIKKQLDEFYKLDCEDTIGDLKTRFKYKPVKENNYGLKAKDILVVDDKELNQLIPLKKLATYREDEFHVPYKKIKETKQRIRAQLKGESSKGDDNGGKRSKNDAGKPVKQVVNDVETENPESETQNEGENSEKKQSRKQRRKLRLQELKLAPTRRMAYNLDVPKKKKKDKSKA